MKRRRNHQFSIRDGGLDVPTLPALPSLALWLDGSQVAHSDGGSTIASSPYGRIQQIAEPPTRLTGLWTASGTGRPWRELAGLDFHGGDPQLLTSPSTIPIFANNCTIAIAWQSRGGQGNFSLFSTLLSGGGKIGVILSGATFYLESPAIAGGASFPAISTLSPGHLVADCTLILTCTPTQYTIRLTINGAQTVATIPVANNLSTLGAFGLGRWTGGTPFSHMCLSQFVVTAQALVSTEQADLQTFLISKPSGDPSVGAPLIVMLGDSVGAGWPPNYQTTLNALPNPPRMINVAAAGTGTTTPTQIPSYYLTDALPRYSASRGKNILICEGISINDVAALAPVIGASAAAAQVLAAYFAVTDRAKADGWIVLVCTLTPVSTGAAYEAARAIINPTIAATVSTHGHFLADIGRVPGANTPADMTNPAVSVDGTHFAPGGYALLDTALIPALQAALA